MSGFNEELVDVGPSFSLPEGFTFNEKGWENLIIFYIPHSGVKKLGNFKIWTGEDGKVHYENTETGKVDSRTEVFAEPYYGEEGVGDPDDPDMYPVSMMTTEGDDLPGMGMNVELKKNGEKGTVYVQGAGEKRDDKWDFYLFWINAEPKNKSFGIAAMRVLEEIMDYFGWNGSIYPVEVTPEAANFWERAGY